MTVFFSWQSNIKKQRNRIQSELEKSIKKIKKDISIENNIIIDRDTKEMAGSVDIADAIFDKIDRCRIFIADISFVKKSFSEKFVNQNVLIELGYAIRKLGVENIILLFNLKHGKIEELPFDINKNRVLSFNNYDELGKSLQSSIKKILENQNSASIPNRDLDDEHDIRIFNNLINVFPEDTYKMFLEHFWATGYFNRYESDFMDETITFYNQPKNIFLNKFVNEKFCDFIKNLKNLNLFMAKETFVDDKNLKLNKLNDFLHIKDYLERKKLLEEKRAELNKLITQTEESFKNFRKTVSIELKI